ncbi:unnamed protein product [Darwinula stevensoni]|uniref:Phosducin domain-containing protein n=1 Tax=Darwinula stevensoni TaxID=69355 RepID=A0A7R8X7B7_9CRUS|nr:unnamed protein product [Darwinula stevensoni]CAG0888527.1 unnamed protein product [Darwinula stevensoni]
MATLEDKLLGEKLEYYCSSSESDGEHDSDAEFESINKSGPNPASAVVEKPDIGRWEGISTNTGPKGVIKDWQRYKQLETERRAEQDKERLDLIKRLSLTCRSTLDDEKAKEEDEEIQKLLEDSFLETYIQKRMEEMMIQSNSMPTFGKVITLSSGSEFLDAIEKEDKNVTVVIHLYEEHSEACRAMSGSLMCIAQEYPQVKICQLRASSVGVSPQFKSYGVPAILVYKGGNLMATFVSLTQEFGDDFFANEVEGFLIEHGVLPDKSLVPEVIRRKAPEPEHDSDLDLD